MLVFSFVVGVHAPAALALVLFTYAQNARSAFCAYVKVCLESVEGALVHAQRNKTNLLQYFVLDAGQGNRLSKEDSAFM